MKIAGIIKSSLIDYPHKASTVIFIGGCNFRCGYCHNPEIVLNGLPEGDNSIKKKQSVSDIGTEDFLAFLKNRKRFIDAVCISGGEPTIHPELVQLIKEIKELGFAVKLDTNGTNPDMLRLLLREGLADYIAMDIKGPFEKYEEIAGRPVDLNAIKESAEILIKYGSASAEAAENNADAKGFDYEFRTTVCRELLTEDDLRKMISEHKGARKWYLQSFKNPGWILNRSGNYTSYTEEEMRKMGEKLCVSVR